MARFYSGSDEARKRNKEKMYTRSRRTRGDIEEEEEEKVEEEKKKQRQTQKGVGEKVPRNYYTLDHRHSRNDPGTIIFPKLRPSTSNPIFLFFLLFIPLPPPLSLSLSPAFSFPSASRRLLR